MTEDRGQLPAGLYERLMTVELEGLVRELGDLAATGQVDRAEVPIRLADHLRRVAERVLAGRGFVDDAIAQIELVNRLLAMVTPKGSAIDERVTEGPVSLSPSSAQRRPDWAGEPHRPDPRLRYRMTAC